MRCLIAAETETAEQIKYNLEKSGLYPGWEFHTCTGAGELPGWSRKEVDILLLSRFLPGEDPLKLMERLKVIFPAVEVILLAGTAGEQRNAYLRAAESEGFTNVITGRLPGDRPHTIFAALNQAREKVEEYEQLEKQEKEKAETTAEQEVKSDDFQNPPSQTSGLEDRDTIKNALAEVRERAGDSAEVLDKLNEIIQILESQQQSGRQEVVIEKSLKRGSRQNGILVLSSANKGGVGKTTVAVTLAVALSQAGVPTALVDFDLGAPDVAAMLGIKEVPGLEAIAGRRITRNALADLVVRKNGLDILPGPMDSTIPGFKQGELLQILNVLAEMYPVVVCDTPPEYWTKPWLEEIFARADYVLAVVDQSILSENETRAYAPYLLTMGVLPGKIGIVLNKYSPKLHNPRKVEQIFSSGFKKEVKKRPRVVAVIPEDWTTHVQKGYKGEVPGLEDVYSQWHKLAGDIAVMAGYSYGTQNQNGKRSLLKKLVGKWRKNI